MRTTFKEKLNDIKEKALAPPEFQLKKLEGLDKMIAILDSIDKKLDRIAALLEKREYETSY